MSATYRLQYGPKYEGLLELLSLLILLLQSADEADLITEMSCRRMVWIGGHRDSGMAGLWLLPNPQGVH